MLTILCKTFAYRNIKIKKYDFYSGSDCIDSMISGVLIFLKITGPEGLKEE